MDDIVFNGTGGMWEGNLGNASASINMPGVLDFNGSSDYISVADHNDFSFGDGSNDSAFSVGAWIKAQDLTNFPIICKGVYNSTGEWFFQTNSSQKLEFYLADESVADNYIGRYHNVDLTSYENYWMHVCATYNGDESDVMGGVKLYINGKEVAGTNMSGNGSSYVAMENGGGDLHIGRSASIYANGKIADVKIFNSELSSGEVGRLASHIGVNNLAVQDTDTRVFDVSLLIHHSGSKLDGAHNDSTTTIVNLEANKAELSHTEESNFVDNNNQRIVIGNEVMVVNGVAQVNASTETNSFAATDGTTPGTVNIDGVTITITTSQTAAQVAALVAAGDYPNYNAAVTNTDKVTFTHKGLGAKTHGAITMSDAVYVKTGGGNHTITAGSFANGSTNLTVSGRSGASLHGTTAAAHSDNDDIYIIGLEDLSTQSHSPVLNGDITSPITHADFDQFEFQIAGAFGARIDTTKDMIESLTATETGANLTNGHGSAFQVGEIITMKDGGGMSGELIRIDAIDNSGDPDILTLRRGVGGTNTSATTTPAGASHDNPSDIYYANATYSYGPITVRQGIANCGALTSVRLDGSNDTIELSSTIDQDVANGGTYSLWWKADENNVYHTFFAADSSKYFDWGHDKSGDYDGKYGAVAPGGGTVKSDLVRIEEEKWYHAVAVYEASGITFYHNGVAVGGSTGQSYSGSCLNGALARLGSETSGGSYELDGCMRDLKFFDRALTAEQVKALYVGDSPYIPPNWWKMDDGSGTTCEDYGSGTDRDGTLTNGPTWENDTIDLDYEGSTMDGLSIGAKGELIAPKGIIQIHYDVSQQGIFTNNGGTLEFANGSSMRADDNWTGTSAINNLKITAGSTYVSQDAVNVDIEGDVTGAGGISVYHNSTVTLGTTSRACAYDAGLLRMWTTYSNSTLQGASELYPAVIDVNTDMLYTNPSDTYNFTWKWLKFDRPLTNGNGDELPNNWNAVIGGSCWFADLTVAAGADLDVNGKRIECTGTFINEGTTNWGGATALHIAKNFTINGANAEEEGANFIANGSGSPINDFNDGSFVGDANTTILLNSTCDLQTTDSNFVGNFIVGSGKTDSKGGTLRCTDLTVATGSTWDPENDTIDMKGDLTMSGGLIGKSAADFITDDGTTNGNYINCGDATDSDSWANMTVECWINLDHLGRQSSESTFFSRGSNNLPKFGLYSGKLRLYGGSSSKAMGGTGDNGDPSNQETLVTGKWYHVACTYNNTSGAGKLYVNGKLDSSATIDTGMLTADVGTSCIGAQSSGNRHMDGRMGRISVWDHELTAAEIRAMMFYDWDDLQADDTNFPNALRDDCVFFYQFDEGTGDAIADKVTTSDRGGQNDGAWQTRGSQGAAWAGAPTFDAESEGSGTYSIHKFSKGSGTQYIYGINGTRLDSVEITSGSTVKLETINDSGGELKIYGVLTATGNLQSGTTASNSKVSFWTGGLTHVVGSAANSLSGLYALEMSHGSGTVTMPAMTVKRFIQEGAGTTELAGALTVGSSTRSAGAAAINDLTVSAGKLDVGSSGENITCTNDILISGGELDADATSSDGNVSAQSITLSGGVFNAPSHGTVTVTSQNVGGWCFYHSGGTFNANAGTIKVDFGAAGAGHFNAHQPHNVIIEMYNSSSSTVWRDHTGNTMSISGDLTIVEGFFKGDNSTDTLTVTGDVSIESGGTLGQTSDTRANNFGSLTIASGATFNATSGTTTITDENGTKCFDNQSGGTFTHNNGTLKFASSIGDTTFDNTGADDFYNLTCETNGDCKYLNAITVLNNLTINHSNANFAANTDGSGAITVRGITKLVDGIAFSTSDDNANADHYGFIVIEGGTFRISDTSSATKTCNGIRNIGGTLSG